MELVGPLCGALFISSKASLSFSRTHRQSLKSNLAIEWSNVSKSEAANDLPQQPKRSKRGCSHRNQDSEMPKKCVMIKTIGNSIGRISPFERKQVGAKFGFLFNFLLYFCFWLLASFIRGIGSGLGGKRIIVTAKLYPFKLVMLN